jgi:phytanoyl-CoA hydroxylase
MIDERATCSFDQRGYVVARGLFDAGETAFLRAHFMRLREAGGYPGDVVGADPSSNDPLKRYPRMVTCTVGTGSRSTGCSSRGWRDR